MIGVASLVGIWIAGITADSRPRRSLLTAVALFLLAFALLPVFGGTWAGAFTLLALWGTAFGAIGIYNQAAILRAGGEHRDAANSLTVVTIQLGIAVGAAYGARCLHYAGCRARAARRCSPRSGRSWHHRGQPEERLPGGPRETA